MIHLWCLGLVFAPEIEKVLVDLVELGVGVKHSRFLQLLVIDHYLYDNDF